jgi:hypothetical protein
LPDEIVQSVMGVIRNSFYAGDDKWFAQQHDIKRMVVTWPANWLTKKGVTLPGARFKEILIGILMDIKHHGDTEGVKYWPRYLFHCVQQHFKHHGDEIYEEAKALRHRVDSVLMAVGSVAKESKAIDPVEAIALAHRVLSFAHKRKHAPKPKEQLDLL